MNSVLLVIRYIHTSYLLGIQTMTALQTTNGKTELSTVSDQTRQFIAESLSAGTLRAYKSDLKIFAAWCAEHDVPSMPATSGTVADFLSDQATAGLSASSLTRRVAAIKYAHEAHGHQSPTTDKIVSATMKGIRRNKKQAPDKKAPATANKIITMLAHCDTSTLPGKRDKALLLIGFAGAFRRSELAALKTSDIKIVNGNIKVTIRSSKTDQTGQGQTLTILNGQMNAVAVLQDWLDSAGIESGYLFRGFYRGGKRIRDTMLSGQAIADIVKAYAIKSGLNPAEFAGHSLRSGFITSAAESGASLMKIMDQSRHKTVDIVRGYIQEADQVNNHAGASFL